MRYHATRRVGMYILSVNSPEGMLRIVPLYDQEVQIIKALRRRDSQVQRQVYERYASRMLGVCMRYLGDQMTAEDILVEGFLKVFDKIDQYKGEGSFEGWIRRIMVNESLGYLRQRKRLLEVPILDEAQGITESTSKSQLHRARALLQQLVTKWEKEI